MGSFDISFNKTVKAEGAYQNDPKDLGNYVCSNLSWAKGKSGVGGFTCSNGSTPILIGTKYGISAPVLANFLKRLPTVSDMKNLDISTVKLIYKNQYWNPLGLDGVNTQSLADLLFDGSVNEGEGKIQGFMADSVLVSHSTPINTVVSKINSANQQTIFETLKKKRHDDYVKQGGTYLTGWLNRLGTFDYTGTIKKNAPILGFFLSFHLLV